MQNPIQSVLAAEQAAQDQIDTARSEAAQALERARARARSIIERCEGRTQRAVAGYEKGSNRALSDGIQSTRKRHRHELQQHVARIDAILDGIVEDAVEEFWPDAPERVSGAGE